jgi:hypothetical protein
LKDAMPDMPAPSPSGVTLAVEVPDYRTVARLPLTKPLLCQEANDLAAARVDIEPGASVKDTLVAVALAADAALPHRQCELTYVGGHTVELSVYDPHAHEAVRIGEFAPVEVAA